MTPTSGDFERHIGAAAQLLGMQLHVAEGTDWHLTPGSLQIGAEHFTSRGHDLDSAIALTLRDAWLIAPGTGQDPARSYRRMKIARLHPELEPLLITIDVLHGQLLLLGAMPGHRGSLAAATQRDIPEDLRDWSPQAQWLGLLRRTSLGLPVIVEAPIMDLLTDQVRHTLWHRGDTGPVAGFDRYLAVTLPATLSLMRGGGLADTNGAGTAGDADAGIDADATTTPATPPGGDGIDSEDGDPDSDAASHDRTDTRQGATGSQDASCLNEQSEVDALPLVLLDTPMAGDHVFSWDGMPHEYSTEFAVTEPEVRAPNTPAEPAAPTALGGSASALAEYRHQLQRHRPLIEMVRDTWKRFVNEQLRLRRKDTNTSTAIPGPLHNGRLSKTVAEVKAGLSTPQAYRSRKLRPFPAPGLGTIDFMLVLDRSGSMQGPAARMCADAAMVFLEALHFIAADLSELETHHRIDPPSVIRSGLIVFGDSPTLVKPLTRGLTDTHRTLMRALAHETGGLTRPDAALAHAEQELKQRLQAGQRHRRIVVFVSDGGFTDTGYSPESGEVAAGLARMRRSGIDVYGLGIGNGAHGINVFAPTCTTIDSILQLPDALARLLTPTPALRVQH